MEPDMISSLANSVSALQAFQKKTEVTANNIANVNTDGFKKSRTDMVEGKTGGVEARISRVKDEGVPIEGVQKGEGVEAERSNVSLTEEVTEGIMAQKGYTANLQMIKSKDEMIGTLLDTFS